jgi:hypothetical protein
MVRKAHSLRGFPSPAVHMTPSSKTSNTLAVVYDVNARGEEGRYGDTILTKQFLMAYPAPDK